MAIHLSSRSRDYDTPSESKQLRLYAGKFVGLLRFQIVFDPGVYSLGLSVGRIDVKDQKQHLRNE